MKIRICSDLHIEFFTYKVPAANNGRDFHTNMMIPPLDTDKETILILAGDITMAKYIDSYKLFFQDLSERFYKIIYVMGNHEHYRHNYRQTANVISTFLKQFDNFYLLDNSAYYVDGVLFVGSTLWTDFDKANPFAMGYAASAMSDFKVIEYSADDGTYKGRWSPELSVNAHDESMQYLEKTLKELGGNKVVVITHHAPSEQSVSPEYKGNILNPAFRSNLDDFILEHQPAIWIHGHVHQPFNYFIGKTNVIANPLGYGLGDENPHYNKTLVMDI